MWLIMVRFRRGKNSINIVLNRKTLTTYNHSSYPIRTQDVFCKDELRNSRNFPLLLGSHTLQSSAWVFFHSIRLRAGSSHCNLIHQRYHDCLLRYGIIQSKHISYWLDLNRHGFFMSLRWLSRSIQRTSCGLLWSDSGEERIP